MTSSSQTRCRGANLARFFELRGWKTTEAGGAYWVSSGTGARWLMCAPDHVFPHPQPGELGALLRARSMLALRYPSRSEPGLPGGLYVCRDRHYSLANVRPSFRGAVRKGLHQCEMRLVEASELETGGLACNTDTLQRQGRSNPEFSNPRLWRRLVEAAWQVPSIEVLGAFVDGQLASYVLSCEEDGWYCLLYSCSRTQLRHHRASHALMYTALERALRRPGVEAVCAGPMTLLATDGLHEFKIRLGFQVEPHRVVLRFHPAMEKLLVTGLGVKALGAMRRAGLRSRALELLHSYVSAVHAAREQSDGQAHLKHSAASL